MEKEGNVTAKKKGNDWNIFLYGRNIYFSLLLQKENIKFELILGKIYV
jgi:hypothetical protein